AAVPSFRSVGHGNATMEAPTTGGSEQVPSVVVPDSGEPDSGSQPKGRPLKGHLAGLDGLRALAVTAVIVFHLNPNWLPGGVLGVDVFFVISGILITTLPLRARRDTGRGVLPGFW